VATALPESTIPVIAIIAGEQSGQIAVGAIIGAPFLLATLGMVVVGGTAMLTKGRRDEGTRLSVHRPSTVRDLAVFLVLLAIALVVGLLGVSTPVRVAIAAGFVVVYGILVWRTVRHGGETADEDLGRLYFDPSKHTPPRNVRIIAQTVVSLGLIVGGAQLFVTEIEHVASALGLTTLVLTLVLAPLASELPEKLNSVLWVRQDKDALALGNITGAMVFQTAIPVAIGMIFLPWRLDTPAVVAMAGAFVGGALALLNVLTKSRFSASWLVVWALMYGGVLAYLFLM
jgi:cation:H+ antiporter